MSSSPTTARPAGESSLYVSQQKIYPREVKGGFQSLRTAAVVVLLGLFYSVPWLRWEERQAILFDLPARKFHLLGITLWPQDFIYLALLLIAAALTLFFFTAILGRIWCGFACPQTVWTEIFMWMERWTEGNRQKRKKLDKAPWTANKVLRKSAKQFLWISFSMLTGFTFVGYFTDIHVLGAKLLALSLGPWEWFWVVFYGFATYGNAGYMREQVCKYMCPYARFQSAMFDNDTLIISYDERRGEQRGSRRRGSDPRAQGLGDCIDCTLCVQVCPTGIDIREGLQYECIACAACVDVCDDVMDKMGYPRGLVRYTSETALAGGKPHVIRPRVLVYGALITILLVAIGTSLAQRVPLGLDVMRDRNALYREVAGDQIENVYTIKILNMDNRDHNYRLSAYGFPSLTLDHPKDLITVDAGTVLAVPVRLRAPRADARGGREVSFSVTASDDSELVVATRSRFIGPVPK